MSTMLILAASATAQPASDPTYQPLWDQGIECVDISLMVGDHQVNTIIASPPKDKLHEDPVLLLVIGRANYNLVPPYNLPARYFLEHGHRVVCLTVPKIESSLEVFRDSVLSDPDTVDSTIKDAQAVLKHCIDRRWTKPGRVVVAGVSRNGYLALRLMAADNSLNVGGGFVPVTDWRDLSEFKEVRNLQAITDLQISRFVDQLAGKTIFLTIGHNDQRVSTFSCVQFFLDLASANARRGFDPSVVTLFVTPDEDHSCGDEWYARGMEILLKAALAQDNPLPSK
jgi:hypothetical protein